MNCTFCQTPTREIVLRSVHVDQCPGCRSVFFDANELADYSQRPEIEAELKAASASAPHRPSARRCPSCEAPTQIISAPQAELDHCSLCGGFSLDLKALTAAATVLTAAPIVHDQVQRSMLDRGADAIANAPDGLVDAVDLVNVAYSVGADRRESDLDAALSDLLDHHDGAAGLSEVADSGGLELLGSEGWFDAGDAIEGAGDAASGVGEAIGAMTEGGAEMFGEALGSGAELAASGGEALLEAIGDADILGTVAEGGAGFFGFFFELIGAIFD